jgi:hypothetical protein
MGTPQFELIRAHYGRTRVGYEASRCKVKACYGTLLLPIPTGLVFVMMGSGVRISLAAPIQVLIGQTGGQGQQTLRHDPFRRRADQSRSRRLGSSAVAPSALTVRTSPRSRRRNPLPFSDAPGWAIDIEAGRSAARPTCHGSPARPRACASLAVDRPIGPSLPQRANVSPAYPAAQRNSGWALSPQLLSWAGK